MIELEFLGIPKPKQSARFRVGRSKSGRYIPISYQSKKVENTELNIAYSAIQQLPKDFKPFDCPVGAEIEYIFPIPKSWSKKKKKLLETKRIYKDTRPDLQDNLSKGLFDALEGIVFINDSRISLIRAVKYYGEIPKTKVKFWKL